MCHTFPDNREHQSRMSSSSNAKDSSKSELFQHDWYGILGLPVGASEAEVSTAARRQSLRLHPDKTSDPDAPAKFLLVQKAKEVLSDEASKKAIDEHFAAVQKREKYEEERDRHMDQQRRRFRDVLEQKVGEAAAGVGREDPDDVLSREIKKNSSVIANIRKQNQSVVEAALQEMKMAMDKKTADFKSYSKVIAEEYGTKQCQVKIKWKKSLNHDEASLHLLLQKYGGIEDIAISSKGKAAVVTFASAQSARAAVDDFAGNEDYRISFAYEESASDKPSVFTHNYTSSSSLNSSLHDEIQKAKDLHQGNASLKHNMYSELSGHFHNPENGEGFEMKRVRKEDFLIKEREVLDLLRNANSSQ